MNATDTQRLAAASFEVVSDARARRLTRATLLVVLAALALATALHLLASGAAATGERARLQQQNSALLTEVARLEAELELERATHAGLDAQVGELNKQLAEMERQLAFVNAQRARARGMAPPH
jgi:septal ring factor EnvC (AmiA/AmiB activator)